MKKILIIHSNMEIGGAETSLLGLLNSLNCEEYKVDLFLYERRGELLPLIPNTVHILNEVEEYKCLMLPIKQVLFKGKFGITLARLYAKWLARTDNYDGYMIKQYAHKFSLNSLPHFKKNYDLAISFMDPHYILTNKVDAKTKLSWLHTDFSKLSINKEHDFKMWDEADYIVNVSESCKKSFDKIHPKLQKKSIVIENILSKNYIDSCLDKEAITFDNDSINLLSIGRFCDAKNFDNVPNICKRILEAELNVKWYLIGYGSDEQLIKDKIKEEGMEDYVIMLGKKENPYPYIKACDFYIQPSRYEGKAVTVREAQILKKPVIITRFPTSSSQLTDGYDGVIVDMDNEGCAKGIVDVINNKELVDKIVSNLYKADYSNASEVEKIYMLMED